MKFIALFLFLISGNVFSQSLNLRKDGNLLKSFSYEELHSGKIIDCLSEEIEVYNAWRNYTKGYVGYNLYEILDKAYSESWRKSYKVIFKALDGYTMGVEVSSMLKASKGKVGLIAYKETGIEGFTPYSKNGKLVNLGPFYLVWSNFSEGDKATHSDSLKWPYQLAEINIQYKQE